MSPYKKEGGHKLERAFEQIKEESHALTAAIKSPFNIAHRQCTITVIFRPDYGPTPCVFNPPAPTQALTLCQAPRFLSEAAGRNLSVAGTSSSSSYPQEAPLPTTESFKRREYARKKFDSTAAVAEDLEKLYKHRLLHLQRAGSVLPECTWLQMTVTITTSVVC